MVGILYCFPSTTAWNIVLKDKQIKEESPFEATVVAKKKFCLLDQFHNQKDI